MLNTGEHDKVLESLLSSVGEFIGDWRKGDFKLPRLGEIDAKVMEERLFAYRNISLESPASNGVTEFELRGEIGTTICADDRAQAVTRFISKFGFRPETCNGILIVTICELCGLPIFEDQQWKSDPENSHSIHADHDQGESK